MCKKWEVEFKGALIIERKEEGGGHVHRVGKRERGRNSRLGKNKGTEV